MVALIENAPVAEQAKMLEAIRQTDPAKAALIKARLLNVLKVYALDDESLGRILEDLDTKVFGLTLRGLDPELRQRALDLVSSERRRKALEAVKRSDLSQPEFEHAQRQLIQKARELESAGKIHFGAILAKALRKAA